MSDEDEPSEDEIGGSRRVKPTDVIAAYRAILASRDGRIVLYDILDRLGLYNQVAAHNEFLTAVALGAHNKAIEIRAHARSCSKENLALLEKENLP